ncbi:Carbamoyl-phosphate synthase small chain [Nymphon striatum]|nr:Carbamoyl-phosphate synthase small chain [Nymphon striatum]
MNKKTTLLGLLGLATISGAGYLYTTGQASQLPQQIGQYLPETVRDYLPASFSPQQAAKQAANEEMVESEVVTPVTELEINDETPVAQLDAVESTMEGSISIDPEQEVASDVLPTQEMVQSEEVEGIDSDVIDDIEQSVSQLSSSGEESKQVNNASMKEIEQLEQELSAVNSQLGGLDAEKLELEDKFQNVLKQNRALAVKLKEIDDQLKILHITAEASLKKRAILVLEDGSVFRGKAIGYEGSTVGEVVFNTALTGYQEILTDPSYASQMVTLTYPHIGNTGTNTEDEECDEIFATGLIVKDVPSLYSSWRAEESLPEYLTRKKVVAIGDIDTRRLTRILREKGAQRGCIIAGDDVDASFSSDSDFEALDFPGLKGTDLAKVVSTDTQYDWNEGSWDLEPEKSAPTYESPQFKVVAYDFGVKKNILRMLADRGCHVVVVPAQTPAKDVLEMKPDGVFLSNGPGDPEPCDYAITAIQTILEEKIPTFGICLGHQLLGLASGAKTIKMKFGHHGANHPVQDLDSNKVMITSQNHGFAVDEDGLPDNIEATHRSLFDNSLQGIKRTDCPAYGFQGHPEASPGPHDIAPIFDQFITLMTNKTGAR